MKILHITSAYEPAWHLGGVVRAVSQVCRGLVQLGQDVTVFTTDSGLDRRMDVKKNQMEEVGGVKVFYFKTDYLLKYFYSTGLREACNSSIQDFELVHLASPWAFPGIAAGRAARRRHLPYVVSTHGSLMVTYKPLQHPKKWLYLNLIERSNLHHASAIHYTTDLERDQSDPIVRNLPSFIVPNGVDISEFNDLPDKNLSRKEHGLPLDALIVLYFGRLEPRKGLDILLQAFAKASTTCTHKAVLILAGPDFGQQALLQELANNLHISEKVIFPGYIPPEQRKSFLVSADIMALVAHPGENFGISALEGMLAGLPVLLSTNVGFYKAVLADKAGMAVPLRVEDVAQALSRMLSDPVELRSMAQAAVHSARRRYNITTVAEQMLRAYADILSGRRNPELSWA
ncbi:MAG: glycosyltransferase [Desulfobaccales bacterium]